MQTCSDIHVRTQTLMLRSSTQTHNLTFSVTHTHTCARQIIYTSCWHSDTCYWIDLFYLFYLLNNLPSIEKWKEEVEESGEEKGDMDVQRDLNLTNI